VVTFYVPKKIGVDVNVVIHQMDTTEREVDRYGLFIDAIVFVLVVVTAGVAEKGR